MKSSLVLAIAVVAAMTVAVTSMALQQGVDDLLNENMAFAERELGDAIDNAQSGGQEKRACYSVCVNFIIGRGCVRWGQRCKRGELERRSFSEKVDDLTNENMELAERELGDAIDNAQGGGQEKRACYSVCVNFIVGRGCVRWGQRCKRGELDQGVVSEDDYVLESNDNPEEGTAAIGKRAPACYRVCLSFLFFGGCARWGSTCRRELTAETLPALPHIAEPKNCYYQCVAESADDCTRMDFKCPDSDNSGKK